jgi:NAD(P)-dependent dehydrogenase (short-subunit alcohol dehydrogenase family)
MNEIDSPMTPSVTSSARGAPDGPGVVVFGGDTGAGAALAAGLTDLGASVATLPAESQGGRHELRQALEAAGRRLPALDGVVIASVGATPARPGPLAELDPDAWSERVERPLQRTLWCFQAASACLLGGGAVVLLVPTESLTGAAGLVPWAAVTEGQRALAKAAARAWGNSAITVNCVAVPAELLVAALAPGHDQGARLDRPGLPAPALRRPDVRAHVAPVVHTLLSPGWRSVTGATVAVDGGVWMTP